MERPGSGGWGSVLRVSAASEGGKKTGKAKKKAAAGAAARKSTPTAKKKKAASRPAEKAGAPATRKPEREPDTSVVRAAVSADRNQALAALASALELLQAEQVERAEAALRGILAEHSGQLDVADRVRMYLRVCESHGRKVPPGPRTVDEWYDQGVLRLNDGELDDAVASFEKALSDDARCDKAHYGLASAWALRGEIDAALMHLRKAIDLDPVNGIQAANDSDLLILRDSPDFAELLNLARERCERGESPSQS